MIAPSVICRKKFSIPSRSPVSSAALSINSDMAKLNILPSVPNSPVIWTIGGLSVSKLMMWIPAFSSSLKAFPSWIRFTNSSGLPAFFKSSSKNTASGSFPSFPFVLCPPAGLLLPSMLPVMPLQNLLFSWFDLLYSFINFLCECFRFFFVERFSFAMLQKVFVFVGQCFY